MDVNYHAVLEACLGEILSFLKPSADDILKRQDAIEEIAVAIQSDRSLIEAGAAVKPFGSYISELYTKCGDLDISIDLAHSKPSPDDRKRKINVLHKIMRALQRTGIANNVEFVRSARVPLLVYTSKCCNISCDISIDNHAGYVKSCILRWISNTDKRFCEFVLLIKEWAKAQHINDPKTGTFNSYSLCLLIIFHFQTCTPAILPPLKDLYEGNIVDGVKGGNTLRHIEAFYAANIERYMSKISRHRNQSSLSELLTSFFDKDQRWDQQRLRQPMVQQARMVSDEDVIEIHPVEPTATVDDIPVRERSPIRIRHMIFVEPFCARCACRGKDYDSD